MSSTCELATVTESEALFADYLSQSGISFDYEPQFGSKSPDFGLKDEHGNYQALAEVKELEWPATAPGPENGVRGVDSYTPIRERINQARAQFKFAKDLPCMLVLFDKGSCFTLDYHSTYGAMLGDITIRIPLRVEPWNPGIEEPEDSIVFGQRGKMRNYQRNEPQNTTISAVAVLERIAVDRLRSGFDAELSRRMGPVPEGMGMVALSEVMKPIWEDLVKELEQDGLDLTRTQPRLQIYKNPFARIPWPEHLCSEVDEVWGADDEGRLVRLVNPERTWLSS